MAAGRREQGGGGVRLRPAGVKPIEVWDFQLDDGRILWDVRNSPEFPDVLARVLENLRAGRGESRSARLQAEDCRAFDAVYVSGGASRSTPLRERLSRAPFEVIFSGADTFCGELGGFELLRGLDPRRSRGSRGMVVDVGQTRIKISIAGRRFVSERDWERLPIFESPSAEEVAVQRARLRSFLADSLRRSVATVGAPPDSLLLALPSELDDDGTPHGCSYAGLRGDRDLVPDALEHADLDGLPVYVLNDAELAAVSARCELGSPRPARTLVVTVGFGIGAAMLE